MSDVVLHIGMPRTATTFLQQNIFKNMEDTNFCLKPSLATPIEDNKLNLLSQENLCGEPFSIKKNTIADRYTILSRCKKLFPNAKAIFCIRDKNSMIKSLYAQYIREGGTKSFMSFKESELCYDFFNYEPYLDLVLDTYGRNNVYVYNYEMFKKNSSRIIDEMCGFMGSSIPIYDKTVRNKSLTPFYMYMCRNINKMVRTSYNPAGVIPKNMFVNWNRWFK